MELDKGNNITLPLCASSSQEIFRVPPGAHSDTRTRPTTVVGRFTTLMSTDQRRSDILYVSLPHCALLFLVSYVRVYGSTSRSPPLFVVDESTNQNFKNACNTTHIIVDCVRFVCASASPRNKKMNQATGSTPISPRCSSSYLMLIDFSVHINGKRTDYWISILPVQYSDTTSCVWSSALFAHCDIMVAHITGHTNNSSVDRLPSLPQRDL